MREMKYLKTECGIKTRANVRNQQIRKKWEVNVSIGEGENGNVPKRFRHLKTMSDERQIRGCIEGKWNNSSRGTILGSSSGGNLRRSGQRPETSPATDQDLSPCLV